MSARWSSSRLAAGTVLGMWAALFWFLLASGRWSLYLSTRTFWVVPTGALLLTIATVGRLATARVARPEPVPTATSWTLGVIALPVVLILALPPATLSGYALGRRSGFVGSGVNVSSSDIASGDLSFIDIAAAQSSREGMAALRARAAEQVTLEGFVWRQDGAMADEILLTRYVVTCCVADATSAQVRVVNVPPGRFQADDWVSVTGLVYPLGGEILVDASDVHAIPQPSQPYLTP
jgi:uncharacterized repeat protein (TIGR03943 family)